MWFKLIRFYEMLLKDMVGCLLGQILLKISGWDEEKISSIKGESLVPSTACTHRYAQNLSGPVTGTNIIVLAAHLTGSYKDNRIVRQQQAS